MASITILRLITSIIILAVMINATPQADYPTGNATNSTTPPPISQPYLTFVPFPTNSCEMSENPFDTTSAPHYNITREACLNGPYSFSSFVIGQPAGEDIDTSDCEITFFQEGDCSLGMEGQSASSSLDDVRGGNGACVILELTAGSVVWSCGEV